MPRVRSLSIIFVALALLAACTPTPSVTASPTPVLQCTPESGGTPAPCSKADHDAMVAKDALYAEAEQVYRKYFDERVRLWKAGGTLSSTPVIDEVTTGPFKDDTLRQFKQQAEEGWVVRGEVFLAVLRRNPGVSKGGSVVSLVACTDQTKGMAYQGSTPMTPGTYAKDVLYFDREGGSLKVWGADGSGVSTCVGV